MTALRILRSLPKLSKLSLQIFLDADFVEPLAADLAELTCLKHLLVECDSEAAPSRGLALAERVRALTKGALHVATRAQDF
jgi:hypothetical protein